MRPPSLGLTLRADPATLAQFARLASVLGVSRSRLATAAVVDGVEALLEQPEVRALLSGAPPCRPDRGGEARRPSGTASDEAERHQSSATGPGVSIHPPSCAPRGEEVSVSASSSPAQSVGVSVAEQPSKARRWGHNAIKRRRVQRDRGRPDTSSPLTLASAELFDCAALRARITERGCAANKKRARADDFLAGSCGGCPGVKALAKQSG